MKALEIKSYVECPMANNTSIDIEEYCRGCKHNMTAGIRRIYPQFTIVCNFDERVDETVLRKLMENNVIESEKRETP